MARSGAYRSGAARGLRTITSALSVRSRPFHVIDYQHFFRPPGAFSCDDERVSRSFSGFAMDFHPEAIFEYSLHHRSRIILWPDRIDQPLSPRSCKSRTRSSQGFCPRDNFLRREIHRAVREPHPGLADHIHQGHAGERDSAWKWRSENASRPPGSQRLMDTASNFGEVFPRWAKADGVETRTAAKRNCVAVSLEPHLTHGDFTPQHSHSLRRPEFDIAAIVD